MAKYVENVKEYDDFRKSFAEFVYNSLIEDQSDDVISYNNLVDVTGSLGCWGVEHE